MLDNLTKQHIDNLCDILVGVVPDPKSQADQIKTALIYKFMDDMDKRSISIGGKASFFSGEYEKYAWSNLMATSLGGIARRDLYMEALIKMQNNTSLPVLFHRIFEDASLPFTNSETLSLFLKEIDLINYDDSERLGDAFEYLLAKMGAQGKAGQFRTPRHIIDFIVKAVDPGKNDRILDPACGTGGFLISAYNHILSNHTGDNNLTGQENKRLTENIHGYDISPEMVRFSLVNMYLHHFPDPQVHEYDTLTNDARWEDKFDVILANPPFMTPRGGIRPHNRFAVRANRAEVLFVDYIMEHLSPEGRAGIIVPEGIISQSSNAYKQLRKMLVEENYLYAVVSLPAGVFNPYAGVKTSILFLDRKLAKQTDTILFFSVENDGFDLGAQRNPINENDLPIIAKSLQQFKKKLFFEDTKKNIIIKKSRIIEDTDYTLNYSLYIDTKPLIIRENLNFVEIKDVIQTIPPPFKFKKSQYKDVGKYPIIDQSSELIAGWTDDKNSLVIPEVPVIIFGDHTCVVKYVDFPFAQGADGIKIIQVDSEKILPKFFFYVLKTHPIESEGYKRHFSILKREYVPLIPKNIQQDILIECEGYEKVIAGARQVVENYRPHIPIDPAWPLVELGSLFEQTSNNIDPKNNKGNFNYIGLENIESNTGTILGDIQVDISSIKSAKKRFIQGNILYGRLRPNLNKVYLAGIDGICSTDIFVLRDKERNVDTYFYSNYFRSKIFNENVLMGISGAQLPRVNWSFFSKIKIPLPSLEIQKNIAEKLKKEKEIIDQNSLLIEMFEKKIEDRIATVWSDK